MDSTRIRTSPSPSLAREALPSFARFIEDLDVFQSLVGSRDPRLEMEMDWDGVAAPEACLESMKRLLERCRKPEAFAALESAVSALGECVGMLEDLHLAVEVDQDDPGEPVYLSEFLVGAHRTLNTLRDISA